MEPVIFNSQVQILNQAGGAVIEPPTLASVQALLSQTAFDAKLDVALSTRLAEATFTARIGEVQASPTANTVLARLKSINDTLIAGVTVSGAVTVSGTVAATQSGAWNITNITGTVSLPTGAATAALQTQPGVDIGDVTVNNGSGAGAVNIQDGGNSITVDGTIAATQSGAWNITNITGTVSLPTGAATAALQTQPGVDIGDVTINNAGAGAAVNIQDGGNSITVDGTIAATQSGAWNITNITGTVSLPTGAATAALQTQPGVDIGDVTINNAGAGAAVNIQDGGNSITVDGTVAATQSGTWNINNISGTISLPTGAATSANQSTEITSLGLLDDVVFTDDAAFTPGTSKVSAIGFMFDDVSPDAVDEGDIGAARINKLRAVGVGPLHTQTADLSNVNVIYDDSPTTASSQDVDCDGYAHFALSLTIDSTNTPTDIQLIIEFKDADGNYCIYQNGFWARLKIEDTEVATAKSFVWSSRDTGGIPPGMKTIRLRVVCTGTTASNTFEVTEAKIGLSTV